MRNVLASASGVHRTDLDVLQQHRRVWAARAELRSVYQEFFDALLGAAGDRRPIVELGAGPGFFKEYCPRLIAADVLPVDGVDLVCDACALPFTHGSVGAIVLLDVLHHLPRPLDFMTEAARVLAPGGRLAIIEPWMTPASYLLYRYFHHEECRLSIDVARPFATSGKRAFDGNATIPFKLMRHYRTTPPPLQLVRHEPFLALPYLATLGFKRSGPLPRSLIGMARWLETALGPIGRWNATRALQVWEKPAVKA